MDNVEPSYVQRRYPPNIVFADFAENPDGRPYTGTVRVTIGVADWQSSFKDGIRHGWFSVIWGGRVHCRFLYENGVEVEPRPVHQNGGHGDV